MTPATWGDVLLSLFPAIMQVIGILLTAWAVLQLIRAAVWLWLGWRKRARLRDLMDDGDGQGGVPPIARKLAAAAAQTQAISMRDLTAMERIIPPCPEFCADLTVPGDGADCQCPAPCGRDWCTRKREQRRDPVPVTWTEREEGVR